jgi:Protein of unknown function (DUF1549)/Protein of unknown function (DUF1553)
MYSRVRIALLALAVGFAPALAAPPAPEPKPHWAFQPVNRPPIPAGRDSRNSNPIDAFMAGKSPIAPPADKRTLIRRVNFDLIGLPPTPQEIDAFLNDQSPDAFAKVVDRLLASPHYGERWGRHWLDVVRYAESTANDSNSVMRYAWRYRDYVVDAFNRDLPYDQFLVEQLAGDLLPPSKDPGEQSRRIIATGFYMIGPKALAETDKEQVRMDVVDDQIDVIGRAMLGLTLSCARCHDHKFDPILAADYYGLAGILRGGEVFRDEVANAQMWQEYSIPGPDGKPIEVMAPKESKPVDLKIHLRGNRFTLGPIASRRVPQAVAGDKSPAFDAKQSGRLQLARWIASPENPLTARVMVNRLWQHHFGTGIVATSDNFGLRGEAPLNPELLDWLAAKFVDSGWSIKAMHRLIVLSETYQQVRRPRRLDAEAIRDAMLAVSGRLDARVGGDESGEFLFKRGEVIDKKREFFRPNRVNGDDPFFLESRRRSLYLPMARNAAPDVLTVFDAADPNAVTAVRNDTTVPSQALFLLNSPFVRTQGKYFAERLLALGADEERVRLGYRLALGREASEEEKNESLSFVREYQARLIMKGKAEGESKAAAWQSFCQTLLSRNEFLCAQ